MADYLAVIKGNKKNNIPAVLIEHCFISNASDRSNFLSSESKIKSLGVDLSYVIDAYKNLNIGDHFFRPFFELLVGTDHSQN